MVEMHEYGIRDPEGIMYNSRESQSNNSSNPDTRDIFVKLKEMD
jgi:hypothetical protein